jgi:hypothetical protein
MVPIIMGIPLHIIITGIPIASMEFMASQASFIISMLPPSMGIILQTIPSFPISKDIRQVSMRVIMGIIIGPMPIPMPPIIGMGIGICIGIPIGPLDIPIIPIGIWGICICIGICIGMPIPIIGIWDMWGICMGMLPIIIGGFICIAGVMVASSASSGWSWRGTVDPHRASRNRPAVVSSAPADAPHTMAEALSDELC